MSQIYTSAESSLLSHPLEPSPAGNHTVTPSRANNKIWIPTPIVHLGGKEEQLNEQLSQQTDVELVWEREQQRLKEQEATQDKFATLFEPPTPRASPTLLPSTLPPDSASTLANLSLFDHPPRTPFRHHSWRIPRPNSIASISRADFGSFEAAEDPLSVARAHDSLVEGRGGDATPSAAHTVGEASPKPLQRHSNTTLEFFDKFTHHAKQRSSAARSQVLDELLLHEDDPMWFVFEDRSESDVSNHQVDPHSLDATSDIPTADSTGESSEGLNETGDQLSSKSILLDVDHDYFRPSPTSSSHVPFSRSLSPTRHRMPTCSSAPPVIAPPVACQLTASPPASHGFEVDPLADSSHSKPSLTSPQEELEPALGPNKSSSFSTLSSKLISSLLRGTQSSPPSPSSSKLADAHPSSDRVEGHGRSVSILDTHRLVSSDGSGPPHSLTLATTMSPVSEGRAIHFSTSKQRVPFGPAVVNHTMSPFAATLYSPPSGAPGFKGDRYDWDKGFSDELESEQKGNLSATADVDSVESVGNRGVSGTVAKSRVAFGSGGSDTGSGPAQASPSSSVPVQDNGLDDCGREGRNLGTISSVAGSDISDWRDQCSGFNRHERHITSSTDTGSAMGELIERKIGTIELAGRRASSDPVLMPELACMLRAHLPALSRLSRSWTLIYSLDQHGISLKTLYSRCEAHLSKRLAPGDLGFGQGMLLAIKDSLAEEEHRPIFGAWIAEGLKLNKGKGHSGGGESFLWKYVDGVLKVFKATGKNDYIALCEPNYLSFGGGDGHYGLYLDDTLFEGSSASCPTFDNEPLCAGHAQGNLRSVKFECLGLEVWGMA